MLHSVIVGINDYSDSRISDLSYAVADAERFATLLKNRIHPAERTIQLLVNRDATHRNLRVSIGEDLARLTAPDDIVLLYFAGHGAPETEASPDEASRYLIVHDTEYENVYATGIDMERDLRRWFQRIREPQLVVLFIDACFSGRAGGRTFEGPQLRKERTQKRTSGLVSLKGLELGEGRLMLAACDDNQVAREDSVIGHGVFTHHLLEVLTEDSEDESCISITSLYEEVARRVSQSTGGRQIPIMNGRNRLSQLPRLL